MVNPFNTFKTHLQCVNPFDWFAKWVKRVMFGLNKVKCARVKFNVFDTIWVMVANDDSTHQPVKPT
ncbi:hypothetical protein Hanom_Chr14g01251031 [Helianthus anomalus]